MAYVATFRPVPPVRQIPRRRGLGAIAQQAAKSAAVGGATAAVNMIPVVGPFIAPLVPLVAALNKPYGTCAPNAPDAASFIQCWSHGQPADFIPYWKGAPTKSQPGTAGWDFAWCGGASGGHAPSGGCNITANSKTPGFACDCRTAPCVCAPAGAVVGNKDGSFSDASGSNLGPPLLSVAAGSASPIASIASAITGSSTPGSAGGGLTSIPSWVWIGGGLAVAAYFLMNR